MEDSDWDSLGLVNLPGDLKQKGGAKKEPTEKREPTEKGTEPKND